MVRKLDRQPFPGDFDAKIRQMKDSNIQKFENER